ncbi:hypothetical protein [uncultured Thiodictyon sp.]|jgi:hypothetical protein|uniref:hypothetical protein n=1 Tax=uncultured Thiodictyon sp. TaxID=1846217 RepID=UPI0025E3BE4F|nr:hypothetical protein [uncultured Thiodictyon sp.]
MEITNRTAASIIVPATAVCRSAFRPTDWERRTPVRPGLSAARNAAVASEIAPHWGAALPVAGILIEARKPYVTPDGVRLPPRMRPTLGIHPIEQVCRNG